MATLHRHGKLIVVFTIIVTIMVGQASAQMIGSVCDRPASEWMQQDELHRNIFVMGFVAGLEQSARFLGGGIRQTGLLTYDEMGKIIYRHLMAHPELRQGPIGEIILDALRGRLVFTDKFGNPYKAK
jgi:hypothetical protein